MKMAPASRLLCSPLLLLLPLLGLGLGCEGRDETPVVTPAPVDPELADPEVDMDPAPSSNAGVDVDSDGEAEPIEALAVLEPVGDSKVKGSVRFSQTGDTVHVHGEVTGLTPGLHGFHVHEKGDLSDKEKGQSVGGHYNPTDQPHGKPEDQERHVGDLGNINANDEGIATIDLQDDVIRLDGEHSIVGRALVIHAGEDKFTQPAGDAGARVAFGVIKREE